MSMSTFLAYVAKARNEPLEEKHLSTPELQPNEVRVRITACGVCYSDAAILKAPYNIPPYTYPLCAGHEGVGIVEALGANVKHLQPGDRVGCGVHRDSCLVCEHCVAGNNNRCEIDRKMMFACGNTGCFAELVTLDSRFAFRIPEKIPDVEAAPLMCAGITVFAPFRTQNIKPGHKVGVMGIGGLGHLALQFARSYGCEVFALSSSPQKKEEAEKFGAHHFLVTKPNADGSCPDLSSISCTLDFILDTSSADVQNIDQLLGSLKKGGKYVILGIKLTPISLVPFTLVHKELSIVGSAASNNCHTEEMLKFAALHNIKPQVQLFKFKDINKAIEVAATSSARYRAVLQW